MSTDDDLRMAGDSDEQQAHEGTKDDRTYYRGPVMMRGRTPRPWLAKAA